MSGQENYDDIFEKDTPEVRDNALAQIRETAEQQQKAEIAVEKAEEELTITKKEFVRISQMVFPELLRSLEMTENITVAGFTIKLIEKLRGNISIANRDKAMKWLNDKGHGDIIKRQIIIEFGKDEEKWADKFMRDCNQRKKKLNMKVKRSVHAQTLQSWCREMLADGEVFPMELFGVFIQTSTEISHPLLDDTPF